MRWAAACAHLLGFDTPALEPFKCRGQAGRGGSIGIDVSETDAERVLWDHDIGRLRSFQRPELVRANLTADRPSRIYGWRVDERIGIRALG